VASTAAASRLDAVAGLRGPEVHRPGGAAVPQKPAPRLTAKVGFELEVSGVSVHPSQPKGTVLLRGSGWRLETDMSKGVSNLEWVIDPLASPEEVEKAADEVIALSSRMREAALVDPSSEISLAGLCPEAEVACTLKVDDLRFGAHLQSTQGVRLADLSTAIDALYEPEDAQRIERDVDRVLAAHARAGHPPLSKNAEGFVRLLCMYQGRATGGNRTSTAHAYFRMMARSDFCSIHDQLLEADEQEAVQKLILPQPGGGLPLFMEALKLDEDAMVFDKPYVTGKLGVMEPGPRVRDWLESIVEGRNHGEFKKDLLSPPQGFGTHQGRSQNEGGAAKDYGMGALGVHKSGGLGLVLFEIRGARDRPDKIPMNAQLKRTLLREYARAQGFNPALPAAATPTDSDNVLHQACEHAELVMECLSRLSRSLHRPGAMVMESRIEMLSWHLEKCKEVVLEHPDEEISVALVPRIAELERTLKGVFTSTGQVDPAGLPAFDRAVDDFEQVSWRA
jgi:hypothetical protein